MERLEGKVVIVTGASSGVGRAIALLSAREGASVVCADIRKNPIPGVFEKYPDIDTAALIRNDGMEAIYVSCDVSKPEQVERMIAAAVSEYGKLDVIFNNAGVNPGFGTIVDKTDEQLDRALNINLKGVWYCCREAIKQFLKQGGGKIVNISSIGGVAGIPFVPEYCTAKGAVTNLTRQLAVDFGDKNIYVNAICPANVATSMAPGGEDLKHILEASPIKRMAMPDEIAKPAVFLASGDADFITGCIMMVDGGLSCRH